MSHDVYVALISLHTLRYVSLRYSSYKTHITFTSFQRVITDLHAAYMLARMRHVLPSSGSAARRPRARSWDGTSECTGKRTLSPSDLIRGFALVGVARHLQARGPQVSAYLLVHLPGFHFARPFLFEPHLCFHTSEGYPPRRRHVAPNG